MAGYSKRSLAEKLGLEEGSTVVILNPPSSYEKLLGKLPANITREKALTKNLDFIQFFSTKQIDLQKNFPHLKQALSPTGSLWISWPKGSSKITTDLNENIIRDIGLENSLVDVKVIAVDENWSGLKFIYRLKDRLV